MKTKVVMIEKRTFNDWWSLLIYEEYSSWQDAGFLWRKNFLLQNAISVISTSKEKFCLRLEYELYVKLDLWQDMKAPMLKLKMGRV